MSKGNHGQTGAYSLTIRESEGSREERVDGINTLDQEKKMWKGLVEVKNRDTSVLEAKMEEE